MTNLTFVKGDRDEDDLVEEQGLETFPASDPPANY